MMMDNPSLPVASLVLASIPPEKIFRREAEEEELFPDRLPETLKRVADAADLSTALESAQLLLRREEHAPRAAAPPKKKARVIGSSSVTIAQLRAQGSAALFDAAAARRVAEGLRLRLCARCQRWVQGSCSDETCAPSSQTALGGGGPPVPASLRFVAQGAMEFRVDLAPLLLPLLRKCPWAEVSWEGDAHLVDLQSRAARERWCAGAPPNAPPTPLEHADSEELLEWARNRERGEEVWVSEQRSLVGCGAWLDAGAETSVRARTPVRGGAVLVPPGAQARELLRALARPEQEQRTPTLALTADAPALCAGAPGTLAVRSAFELGSLCERSLQGVHLLALPLALAHPLPAPLQKGGALCSIAWKRVALLDVWTAEGAALLGSLQAENRWCLLPHGEKLSARALAAFLRAPLLSEGEEAVFVSRFCGRLRRERRALRRVLIKVGLSGLERACYESACARAHMLPKGGASAAWARCRRLCSHWQPEPGHASVEEACAAALEALARETAARKQALAADAASLGPAWASRVQEEARQLEVQRSFVELCASAARSSDAGSDLCAICQQPLTRAEERLLLPCAHIFHAECLLSYQASTPSGRCSICRRETRLRLGSRVVARPLWVHAAEPAWVSSKMRAAARAVSEHCARQDGTCMVILAAWEARHLRRALSAVDLSESKNESQFRVLAPGAAISEELRPAVQSVLFLSPAESAEEEAELVERVCASQEEPAKKICVSVLYCAETLEEQTLRTRGCLGG